MNIKNPEILPFEEWKSRLLCQGVHTNGEHSISFWNLDGDEEQYMFREDTIMPHFGKIMAAALDPTPEREKEATIHSTFCMTYLDKKARVCLKRHPDTYKETGKVVKEKFDGLLYTECYYYSWVLVFDDYDKACMAAYEMYKRRRENPDVEEEGE